MQINYLVLCNCKISFLLRKKIMSYYQLPDELNYDTPKIQLHVPSDEKGKDLAKHLPYLAQINNPIFQNRVEDLINSDEDLHYNLIFLPLKI